MAQSASQHAPTEPRLADWTRDAAEAQQAEALREAERENRRLQGELAQAERRQANSRNVLASAARDVAELHGARRRCEELEADLAAQRDYSGRVLSNAWAVINRLRSERAQLLNWAADKHELEQRIADLTKSTSWRITAPLRAISQRLRGIIPQPRPR